MMCDRCGQPLTPGETDTRIIPGASGAGGTVHIHRDGLCPTEPTNRPRTYSTH